MGRVLAVGSFLMAAALAAGAGQRVASGAPPARDAGADASVPTTTVLLPAPIFPPAAQGPPSPGDCVVVACAQLASGACRPDDLTPVVELCASQFSGECIADACTRLGPFACRTVDDLRRVAPACRGQIGAGCLRSVCRLAGPLACRDLLAVNAALAGCTGNLDGVCVDLVCSGLGPTGCDGVEKGARVARACAGVR